jgi:flavonoid 3'-monooxygenase
MRKIFHLELISGRKLEESEHVRAEEMAEMVRSIPSGEVVNVKSCLDAMTANIFTRLIIGKRLMGRTGMDEAEAKELQDFIEITDEIDLLLGTPNPRDLISAFQYLDLTGLDRRYKTLRRRMESFLSTIIAEHRSRSPPEKDFLDTLLDQIDRTDGQAITEQVVTSIVWVTLTLNPNPNPNPKP